MRRRINGVVSPWRNQRDFSNAIQVDRWRLFFDSAGCGGKRRTAEGGCPHIKQERLAFYLPVLIRIP